MESWLVDVKRVHIPRPKFGSGSRCYGYGYPTEPPKDYVNDERSEEYKLKTSLQSTNLAKATEELRRALQKL
ncbi:uncharacterized protein LOC108910939 [Anoplophora glabripennis]|uniref:uncharacterized protein LOC108910939 n=1 Tax=Anoplophora glabripennis TaxID=217634 RepID=UPI00087432E2|nr:uncharacterized protein LOC108910939 [Anoplophora glabripennis]